MMTLMPGFATIHRASKREVSDEEEEEELEVESEASDVVGGGGIVPPCFRVAVGGTRARFPVAGC